MRSRGSVTVFFSLVFVMIAALLLSITESARSFSQHFYMQLALDSGIESLFSNFHRPLWERYRILGLEYRTEAELAEELHGFMRGYIECDDLFPISLDKEDLFFADKSLLSEGTALEKEILDYMKPGMLSALIGYAGKPSSEGELLSELKAFSERPEESVSVDRIQSDYQLDSKSMERLEKSLSEISGLCSDEGKRHEKAGACLRSEDDGGFYREAGSFCALLGEHKKEVLNFKAAVGKLEERVGELRVRFDSEAASLSREARELIAEEIAEYEGYVSERGELRSTIEVMYAECDRLIEEAERTESEIREFEEWMAEALSSIDYDSEDAEEEEAVLYEERRSFYMDMTERWSSQQLIKLEIEPSRLSPEKKRQLDNVRAIGERRLTELLLPSGRELPSAEKIYPVDRESGLSSYASELELIAIGEYSLQFFNGYSHRDNTSIPSGSRELELEYLLSGKTSDYENLSEHIKRLLMFRELMNLLFIYKSPELREAARGFAATVLCATANPVLISVLSFFVMGIWAYGQALVDVKTLLSDGRVPLIHSRESFSLTLEGLLELGSGGIEANAENGKGLSYRDYIRLFLFSKGIASQRTIYQRMENAMERNLHTVGEDKSKYFAFKSCIYGLSAVAMPSSGHILLEQHIVGLVRGEEYDGAYSFELKSSYSYKS